jgi:hypothetical protein
MAGARLTIVCSDDELLRKAEGLAESGKELWWIAQAGAGEEFYEAKEQHRGALADFVARARTAAKNGSTI